MFGANLWVALGTQPSVKALVIDGGMFCFPRGIWQCLDIFLVSWWGCRRDFCLDGSTQLYQSWLCTPAITENPQITVAIPVLSRYEHLIIYLQNQSQNLRNSFSLLQKQTSTSRLLSKPPQNLRNQPNSNFKIGSVQNRDLLGMTLDPRGSAFLQLLQPYPPITYLVFCTIRWISVRLRRWSLSWRVFTGSPPVWDFLLLLPRLYANNVLVEDGLLGGGHLLHWALR